MAALSANESRAIVQFLDDVELCIRRLSTEAESGVSCIEDLLLEAETLLQDVSFLSDLFPAEDGDSEGRCRPIPMARKQKRWSIDR